MLMHLFFEIVGAALVAAAIAMLWIAKPVDGGPALFLRKKGRYEVGYTLITLFTLTGGLGALLLGFTT